jgi:glycosyltransferase involved in cell wall biosynthesis
MPVRDARTTVQAAIDSILRQTLTDWEVIVVDDGSPPDTLHILQSSAAEDARIRLIQNEGSGIVPALNAGLRAVRAPLIARMDADDVCAPGRLQAQTDHMTGDQTLGLVGCLVDFGGNREQHEGYALHVDWLNSLVDPDDIFLNRFIESPFAHPSVMFRRELVTQDDGYRNGPFPEDYELWLRWMERGVRMAKVNAHLLTWNDSPDRLSRRDSRYDAEAFYRVKTGYLTRELRRRSKGRTLWVWGAGRPTRKRAELLVEGGLQIAGYIDIDPDKIGTSIGNRPVIPVESLPSPAEAMVVSYVANRGARELIRQSLVTRAFVEGEDFWMAA